MAYGEFVGKDEHIYIVQFDGAGVPSSSIVVSNVVISMDAGDRKFVGFKTTSCKVSIVTDTPLTWAYTESSTGISVIITDDTEGEVVFSGYVVPFTFEQPYTGVADSVTIDCVDDITANKEVKYMSLNDDDRYGVDERGIDIVRNMCSMAGGRRRIQQIVIHKNFDWKNLDEIVLDTKVAQAGFLQDEMTALEAMNAVCVFFGFTSHMVGNRLYLYDEYCLTHATRGRDLNAVVEGWELDGMGGYVRTKYYDVPDSPFREVNVDELYIHDDVTLSIERAYDGVQVNPEGADVSVLLPDVCADNNIRENTDGRGTEYDWVDTPKGDSGVVLREYRKPVESKIMFLGESDRNVANGVKEWSRRAQVFPFVDNGWWGNGAMLLSVTEVERRTAYMGFNYDYPNDPKTLLWIRDVQGDGLHRMGYSYGGYSHTGGYVELLIDYKWVLDDDYNLEIAGSYGSDSELKMFHPKFGNQYFLSDYANGLKYGSNYAYKDSLNTSERQKYWDGVIIIDRGAVMPTNTATLYKRNTYLIKSETDEQITLEIGVDRTVLAGDPVYYEKGIIISRLEMLGYGDEINTNSPHYRREFTSDPREILEVGSVLTTRESYQSESPVKPNLGVNARPGVVPAKNYSGGGYMGLVENQTINGCGILMKQLSNRYNTPHNRYTMTVEGNILPSDKISYNGEFYTVEGYERDLANNTTRIIID